MLEKRTHHETGEVLFRLFDWDPPPRFEAREKHGVHGRPFLALRVFADRVELHRGWCFSSGHMEVYEEALEAKFRPGTSGEWPAGLGPAVSDWFGDDAAAEVRQLIADPGAFAP